MRVHNKPKPYESFSDRKEGVDIARGVYQAYCTSYICTRKLDSATIKKPDAKPTDIFCSKCKSALYWERQDV